MNSTLVISQAFIGLLCFFFGGGGVIFFNFGLFLLLSFLYFFKLWFWDRTRGLVYARQVIYH